MTEEKKTPEDEEQTSPPTPSERLSFWPVSLGLFVFWLVADQLTKLWAIAALRPEWWGSEFVTREQWEAMRVIEIIPGFLQLRYAENPGAAFSLLDGHTGLLTAVSVVASLALMIYWWFLPPAEKWARGAVALILSGAVGNLIDRAGRGAVVDFIDAYIGQYHWPTFNVADSCIVVGAAILAIRFIQGKI